MTDLSDEFADAPGSIQAVIARDHIEVLQAKLAQLDVVASVKTKTKRSLESRRAEILEIPGDGWDATHSFVERYGLDAIATQRIQVRADLRRLETEIFQDANTRRSDR